MIRVVARSEQTADKFIGRHQGIASAIEIELGCTSYFKLINSIIDSYEHDFVCLVHDDVTLGSGFLDGLSELILSLDSEWPNWGIAGNAGVSAVLFGYSRNAVVRYLADPHGGPNLLGKIVPAQTIDGNVMLLNLRALRECAVRMPDFEGFQLYDIILSLEILKAGLAVLVAPHLACWHGSRGNQVAFDYAASAAAFSQYLQRTIINRTLLTLNGSIAVDPPVSRIAGEKFDVQMRSLKNACAARQSPTLAICIRTQLRRPQLLQRAIETAKSFTASLGESAKASIYIITDAAEEFASPFEGINFLKYTPDASGDTRNLLIRFAINNVRAEWFWFVDDDDWVFPNAAERLGCILNVVGQDAIVMVDSQVFNETLSSSRSPLGFGYKGQAGRYFPASQFAKSLSGHNHIPMCGMILSKSILQAIPETSFKSIVYFEDYSLLMHALLMPDIFPVFIDNLFSGISWRESGNSVTEVDRTKWDISMAELALNLCRRNTSTLLTMPVGAPSLYSSGHVILSSVQSSTSPNQAVEGDETRKPSLITRLLSGTVRTLRAPSRWRGAPLRALQLINSVRQGDL